MNTVFSDDGVVVSVAASLEIFFSDTFSCHSTLGCGGGDDDSTSKGSSSSEDIRSPSSDNNNVLSLLMLLLLLLLLSTMTGDEDVDDDSAGVGWVSGSGVVIIRVLRIFNVSNV